MATAPSSIAVDDEDGTVFVDASSRSESPAPFDVSVNDDGNNLTFSNFSLNFAEDSFQIADIETAIYANPLVLRKYILVPLQ